VLYSTARDRLLEKGLTLTLAASDWAAIVGYLLITLFLGLYFRGRSGKSTEDYFVSGRNVSWWLAGTSMVATTFAADTPLVVTGLVYANGVAGKLAVVEFLALGNDDRVPFCAIVAPLRTHYRRAIRRDALFWQPRGLPPWFPRRVPGLAHELPHSWLGHQGYGQHHQHVDGYQ